MPLMCVSTKRLLTLIVILLAQVPWAQAFQALGPNALPIGQLTSQWQKSSSTTASAARRRIGPTTALQAGKTSEAASQNIFGVVSDAVTGSAFALLHAFDDCGIEDSSKNLRVLWVRALLAQRGDIQDDVAATLLPPTTRGLVTTNVGAKLFDPIVKFTEWIQARTDFIDESLDAFLSSPVCNNPENGQPHDCNVVLFGAGYDTRALRYRHAHGEKINFVEVDLPEVVEGKGKLYSKFQRENDPEWDYQNKGSTLVPLDLNDCGDKVGKSLIRTLQKAGLKEGVPTFFVFEAVLFYVNEDAVRNIMDELFRFASPDGNKGAESMICFTDSLKPFVDVPFTSETNAFFSSRGVDLLQHRARWGGAVHFALVASRGSSQESVAASKTKERTITGTLGKFVASRVGALINSYTPTQANNPDLLKNPSFDNVWYAVAYPWQIDGYKNAVDAVLEKKVNNEKPYATRLWGEPLVIYRNADGSLSCVSDLCPHRSAPLSMGTVEDGNLVCFYHGWKFGKDGECVDVPTLRAVSASQLDEAKQAKFRKRVTKTMCSKNHAVVEHEGLVWVWRGNVLEADVSKLPTKRSGDMETVAVDSVLDYSVDYSYIVENNLDSPHLFYLHDGSVPPIESIGMMAMNLEKLRLSPFQDDCGFGHLGKLGDAGRPKKLIRFDPPNIVRHGGVSGFEEEFHIIPIAPYRTRVLLRQHLPKGPILSTITSFPGLRPVLTAIVNNWNYHIGLEDAAVMQGQAHLIEDFSAPRMTIGGLGDDIVKRYWSWRGKAHEALKKEDGEIVSPYFNAFQSDVAGIQTGTSYGDSPQVAKEVRNAAKVRQAPLVQDDGAGARGEIGTWGIKQNYQQSTPAADFPPMNYEAYKSALIWDDLTKKILFGQEPSNTMIKTKMSDFGVLEDCESGGIEPSSEPVRQGSTPARVAAASIGWTLALLYNIEDPRFGPAFASAFTSILPDSMFLP